MAHSVTALNSIPTNEDAIAARAKQIDGLAAASEARRRDAIVEKLTIAAGEAYRGCRFGTFTAETKRQQSVLAGVKLWADGFAQHSASLIMYGSVGTGKDHLAFAAARQIVIQHGVSVAWFNGRALMSMARDRIGSEDSEAGLLKECILPRLLVLSDPLPARGQITDWQADILYRVIERRDANCRPTICTVNIADDKTADAMFGEPTWDRLCNGAWKIHFNWASHRKPSRVI